MAIRAETVQTTELPIKQVRVSERAKDQLIKLKRNTGIGQWNILCRWAFCFSLAESSPPTPIDIPADSNVEMSWLVFGGENHELYLAVLKLRCIKEGIPLTTKEINRYFRLHLHRGIGYLADQGRIKNIQDLIQIAVKKSPVVRQMM